MCEDLKLIGDLAATLRSQIRTVGSSLPGSLEPHTVITTLSSMLATQLRLLGTPRRFGGIQWNSMLPIPDWKGHAEKSVAQAVQPIIAGA